MGVHRVVANLVTADPVAAAAFYQRLLGLEVVMDHGWIATVAAPDAPGVQLSLMTHDATASVPPAVSIGVDDVEAAYQAALDSGAEIVHPLTDEDWGVRRFFVRDPDGTVVNVLSHRSPAAELSDRGPGRTA